MHVDLVPVQGMATLLKEIAGSTRAAGFDTTRGAVLSVPVFFGEPERSAMLTAAELAGFSEMHLMNELTAAALNWAMLKKEELARQSGAVRVAFLDVGHSSTQASTPLRLLAWVTPVLLRMLSITDRVTLQHEVLVHALAAAECFWAVPWVVCLISTFMLL